MDRFDVLFVIGIMLVATGFGLLSIPLGLIAGGAGCIVFAVLGARAEVKPIHIGPPQKNVAASRKDKI
jgi:hypothetical protein